MSRGVLLAHLACYQARIGEFDEAERKRVELRQEFGLGNSQRVSILIMCLEALLLYYRDLDPKARDWLARANLLSVSFREGALAALSFSWLAHLDFNLGHYERMVGSIGRCLHELDHDDGTALCRVALVLGDAFAFAGRETESRQWYDRAHAEATRLGDQAAIGALTYNRAALHVSAARVKSVDGEVGAEALALLGAEVRSAVNYQAVARLQSLDHLLRSASIGVLMLGRQYEAATQEIDKLIAAAVVPEASAERALLLSDQAHCLSALGRLESSRAAASAALSMPLHSFGPDDRALVFGGLSLSSRASGDLSAAVAHEAAQREALAEHRATIEDLGRLLTPFAADWAARA